MVLNVGRIWSDHAEPRQLARVAVAPVDVVLDRDRDLIVQPDVLFIAANRLSIARNQVRGAPDLVAEVLFAGHSSVRRALRPTSPRRPPRHQRRRAPTAVSASDDA